MGRRRLHQHQVERDGSWEPSLELQDRVYRLAGRWSRDRPEYRDDLYQEGLLAIWLKGETDAPLDHQLKTARHRMLSVRKLGKSVDGKLDRHYKRPTPYWVVSLEGEGVRVGEHLFPFHDLLPDPVQVERHVVAKLTLLEILSLLSPEERLYLVLVCQGFTLAEVAHESRRTYSTARNIFRRIRQKLRPWLRVTHGQSK